MKVLLVAGLALLPLAATAPLGHEPLPRQSAQAFELELTALGLGPAGAFDASDGNCVAIRAQGSAAIHSGRATLAHDGGPGPGRLLLEAAAPGAGRDQAAGALPLAMELRAFGLATRDDVATVGAHLTEGSVAAAVGKRVTLTLWLEHAGAPLTLGVARCEAGG